VYIYYLTYINLLLNNVIYIFFIINIIYIKILFLFFKNKYKLLAILIIACGLGKMWRGLVPRSSSEGGIDCPKARGPSLFLCPGLTLLQKTGGFQKTATMTCKFIAVENIHGCFITFKNFYPRHRTAKKKVGAAEKTRF
jgi:hypothetical protein